MKDKKKKGCGQGQEGEESDESDDKEVMIYFGFNNEKKGKEQIMAITQTNMKFYQYREMFVNARPQLFELTVLIVVLDS